MGWSNYLINRPEVRADDFNADSDCGWDGPTPWELHRPFLVDGKVHQLNGYSLAGQAVSGYARWKGRAQA